MTAPLSEIEREKSSKIGTYLRQLRRKRNDTLADMADKLQVTPAQLSSIELTRKDPDEAFFIAMEVKYNTPTENAAEVARCLHKQDILKREISK